MKYTPLSSLQNPYPSISKYRTNANGGIVLNGVYPQNRLDFQTPSLEEFTVIPDSTFKFVVAISNNDANNTILDLLVSQEMYSLLERAKNEPNPYFLNTLLNPNTWVYIYIDQLFKIFQNQREEEKKYAVEIDYNVIFDKEGTPDFTRIGKFLDWIVSPSKLRDIDTNGVIPLEELDVNFSLGGYDHEGKQWVTKEQATFLRKLDDLEDELASVRLAIQEIDNFFNNPRSVREGGYLYGLLGASAAGLVVSVATATPAAAIAATLAAQQVVTKAAAKLAFEGVKTFVSTQTARAAAGKIATSFLGGPVGLGIAIAGIIFSIFQSKRKKRENEERVRRFTQYVETITAERIRLIERELKLLLDIETLNNSGIPIETTTNGGSVTTTNTNGGSSTTTTSSGNNTQIGGGTPLIGDPVDPFDGPPPILGTFTGQTFTRPNGTKWVWLPEQGGWTRVGRKTDRER